MPANSIDRFDQRNNGWNVWNPVKGSKQSRQLIINLHGLVWRVALSQARTDRDAMSEINWTKK